jgi:steroid 5-alpha reductase family enzyme
MAITVQQTLELSLISAPLVWCILLQHYTGAVLHEWRLELPNRAPLVPSYTPLILPAAGTYC